MIELIEKLEAATGPDREIDLQIAIAVWGRPGVLVLRYNEETEQNEEYTHWRYTASIDDALTLVPSGTDAEIYIDGRNEENACVVVGNDFIPDGFVSRAANPAIALCIASLKAREKARQ